MDTDITKFLENVKFASYIGIKLIKAENGYALAQMALKEHHLNGVNIAHGGVIFTSADFAFGAAATELSSTNRLGYYNVDVTDEENNLIARFTGTGYKKSSKNA